MKKPKKRKKWPKHALRCYIADAMATASYAAGQLIIVPTGRGWGYSWLRSPPRS